MKMAMAIKLINKKSKIKKGDYAAALEILINKLSLDNFSYTSCEINPYYDGHFAYSWRKMINNKTGAIITKEKYSKIYGTPLALGYIDYFDVASYEKELKRLKELSKKLKKDGFKVDVRWDKKYGKLGYHPHSPTLVLKW